MPTSKPRRVRTRRTFIKEFKLQVLRELDAGSTITELARIHDVYPETDSGLEQDGAQVRCQVICRPWPCIH